MKIIIAGAGKVGLTLSQQLTQEGHDLVLIDKSEAVLREAQEAMDVAVLHGNGASMDVQTEAGVPGSDILIAATSGDELNILCCLVARKLGCKHTIARVRNPEYDQQVTALKEELGLSLCINPEKTCAREIFRLLQYPSFLKRDQFAKGLVELVELPLKEGNPLIGKKLMEIGELGLTSLNILICAVERDGAVTIPSGPFELKEGDHITVAAGATELVRLLKLLHMPRQEVDGVLIVGGGRISEYLARLLTRARVQVTIIEENLMRCEELTETLTDAIIIHGNGTKQELLLSEGISKTDALVTLTGMDEENLIISMFGNYIGVPKTITKINRTEYTAVFADKGIESIVSPKILTADEIISYVRAIGNRSGGSVVTLTRIVDGRAEATEFFINSDAPYLDTPLHELQLKKNILLAGIIRHRRVIIPKGNDYMRRGDTVVVVSTAENAILNLNDIFAKE